ncbi:OPT family oligopeptide transporter [Tepidiphilus baoligensis]|uniref:Oligopeptide transporter, OPT family n=1 Tax=Tepidiphilus baoligensis TaxID=2698687 RepID=A0ABX1QK48_9PROT|nr:oligopeptide transporter, OPT family [Tepidiphilus baoligensis]NMH16064.1 oligopeptide transporter, OPT family [Tepidiphilus baoligensis]
MIERIPDDTDLPELTLRGMLLGAVLTVIFTAANIYLGLKVGLTFASSIPAAVISMAVLRHCRGANVLENNMVQTQASAAGTLSAIIFILPGLLMIGHWQGFPFWLTAVVCGVGGLLGVVYTIPLRRVMVVNSPLPYPEGVAAAEILRVGELAREKDNKKAIAQGQAQAREIAFGGMLAAVVTLCSSGFRFLAESFTAWIPLGAATVRLSVGFSLALVGAGYLIGLAAGLAILLGLVVAWGVIVPWLTMQATPAADQTLAAQAMSLWHQQVRFFGAGTIGVAALWTLATLAKPMWDGIRTALEAVHLGNEAAPRTERDLSPRAILAVGLASLLVLLLAFHRFLAAADSGLGLFAYAVLVLACVLFAALFGFLIAAAAGYMAGLVGSSSSPISGIGILAVILVSLMLLAFGGAVPQLTGTNEGKLAVALALFTTSVVVAIAAISNDNLQDLKTGYLVGATPWRQQVALMIGCVVGALVIPPVLELLYQAYGFAGALPRPNMDPAQALSAPQATLMTAIAMGIFHATLEWKMILGGVALGAVLILVDRLLRRSGSGSLPVLAVGLGIYLPPTIGMTLVVGALLGHAVARALARRPAAEREEPRRRGVLLASGFIVGESLMGIVLAALIAGTGKEAPLALVGEGFEPVAQWMGLAVLVAVCLLFYRRIALR